LLFPTIEFGIFFGVVFILSWSLVKWHTVHKIFLILASLFFYGYWDWRFSILLVASAVCNYFIARLIGRKNAHRPRLRTLFLVIGVAVNLGILGFFKYYNFLALNVNNVLLLFGFTRALPILNIILPLAISFFTFHALSYLIDVYNGKYPPSTSLPDILLYILFFPHLVAGPIVRAGYFLPQLERPPDPRSIEMSGAVLLIAFGLFKKIFIANYISGLIVDPVFENPAGFSSLECLLAVYGYAVQIFCDFSAYSEIAIGLARLLGYRFLDNFNNPYRAQSIQDFWRRWHISLSSWLRDYLYIPLGGSRKGKGRTYANLLITMFLGGLWHGAAWNFVIWGSLQGVGLVFERLVKERKPEAKAARPFLRKALSIFLTFHFVCLGWIFFRSPSASKAFEYIRSFGNIGKPSTLISPFVIFLIAIGLFIHFVPESFTSRIRAGFDALPLALKATLFGLTVFLMGVTAPVGVAPFIYFQF
jgi:D-alanyl-lipoteichoic acid acyltransferase DltB (MBOAT superfamily)